ncbi:hypothetical protein EPUL_001900, partial [Erysiphe pulchra]
MLLSLVKVALTLIFITKTTSTGLEQKQSIRRQLAYYDCGSWIVYDSAIQKLLYGNGMDIDVVAQPFLELLYGLDEKYREIIIPENLSTARSIPRISSPLTLTQGPGSRFYVIIDQMNQIVDVVAEMNNGHYIKCKLVDESTPEPSTISQNDYGYVCGHDFFSHDVIQMSTALAKSYTGRNKQYLQPYYGPLYWHGINYWIYPLSRDKNQHHPGKRPECTYFVVISYTGEIIDVIAELKHGDFIKCARATKVPPNIDSEEDLHRGYLCGLDFFELNHIKWTAKLAKVRSSQPSRRRNYPKRFNNDSFKGFLYPLFPNGRFHGTGLGHQLWSFDLSDAHFIVMDMNFNVKYAAVKTPKGIIMPCEESMRGVEATQLEKDNFICELTNTEFENERLIKIVEAACKALGTRSRKYPANYHGPAFDVHGPYVTVPIRFENGVMGPPTKFRVVMNTECMLAGVIAKNDEKTFYKCRRSKDNSIPGEESQMPITESPFSKGWKQEQSIWRQPAYYDCGSWIVYESPIEKILYRNGIDIDMIAQPFIELLYNLDKNYREMVIPESLSIAKPIPRIRPGSKFHVIINQMKQIVDVVAKMNNGHYIKCKLVDESTPEPSTISQNDYGYECGHDLFSHDVIQMSADLAQSYNGNNQPDPKLYQGPLYWPGINHWIYPLSRDMNQHHPGKIDSVPENTYFVVISPVGKIIDVIAQLKRGDFIKCARTTKVPPNIDSEKGLRYGYSCELEFFHINHMKRTAELAKTRKLQSSKQRYFPKKYIDYSFEGFMFPLFPNGRFYGTIPCPVKYFIIMDSDFSVKYAAIQSQEGIILPCEKSMIGIEAARPETDNFICVLSNTEFRYERLLKVVKTACKVLGTRKRKYPANYHGPAFDVHGPYVTMPIRYGIGVAGRPGSKFLVIINQMEQIVNVVAKMNNGHFIKCKKVDESTPEPMNAGQNDYGYECGHDLFSHDVIQMSAALARSYNGPENTYYVVISLFGGIIDVIAELRRGDFIKCVRTTKVPPDIDSDKGLRHGYLCGLEFFVMNHIKNTAKLAKAKSFPRDKRLFPKKYKDEWSEGFIYPLLPNGRFHGTVPRPNMYYIVMNLDFSVKYAAVQNKKGGIMTRCEESIREVDAAPREIDNFTCGDSNIEFNNKRLINIIEIVCNALGTRKRKYPANYHGPAFDVHGPYVTWPIRYQDGAVGPPTQFRVVMNAECMLAGVIAKHDEKTFYKCRRSKDNSIPGGESEMPITEKSFYNDQRRKQIKKA